MVWEQQSLFAEVVAEFAERASAHRLARAYEAKWVAYWTIRLHEEDVRNSALWRRRNPRKAKAYGDAYREANRDQERRRVAAWRAANRDRVKKAAAAYRATHRETERARLARWRAAQVTA